MKAAVGAGLDHQGIPTVLHTAHGTLDVCPRTQEPEVGGRMDGGSPLVSPVIATAVVLSGLDHRVQKILSLLRATTSSAPRPGGSPRSPAGCKEQTDTSRRLDHSGASTETQAR